MDNLPGYKPKIIDTRTFGEKVDEFFNPVLTPYINARPDKNRPQYVPEDIPPMEEDYSNTINLIKDIAKRADISQQTKSDLINRLAQRAQKQQAQILSMSAQPYENFSTYMTKRAGLAAQDLIMAPQRIGTAAGEAIGSFGESVITGKPYEEVLAKNKKNRNELLYLSVPQIEQVLTKYGKGENLIKPSKNIQEFLANTNDMLRRERESQYEMGANLGEAKDVIIQGLMGSDYGKIEVPKEFETVAGISGFIFEAVVDPTNLLPGVGIGVSGTKAISHKALRTAISNAENMEDLITAAQKAVVNGVDKKEAEKLFYTRLKDVKKFEVAPDVAEGKSLPQTSEITSAEQISNIYEGMPYRSQNYDELLRQRGQEILREKSQEPIAKKIAEEKRIEDEMNQMWETDEALNKKYEEALKKEYTGEKDIDSQRAEYYASKIPVEPIAYDRISRNIQGMGINRPVNPAVMGELIVQIRELGLKPEQIGLNDIRKIYDRISSLPTISKESIIKAIKEAKAVIPEKPASVSVPEGQVGTITPTIPEKPPEAQISGQIGQGVEEPIIKITPSGQMNASGGKMYDLYYNDHPLQAQILEKVKEAKLGTRDFNYNQKTKVLTLKSDKAKAIVNSVKPPITSAEVIPDVPPVVGKVEELHSLAKSSIAQDPYILYGTKVKVKNQYGEIFEGEVRSLDKTSSGDIVYNINVPELRHSKNDTSRFMADNIIEVSDLKTKKHIELTRPVLEEIEKFPMQSFKNITVPDKIINALPDDIENFQELLHEGVKYFYDKAMDNEARYTKKVSFGNKFMSLTKEGREHVLYHEIGHEVSDRFLVEWSKGLDLSAFGKNVINPQSQKTRFDGISGTYNIGESIAEAYAIYRTDPNWLKTNYPEAYRIVDEVLSGRDIREAVENKFPIAPSAVDEVAIPIQPAGDVPVGKPPTTAKEVVEASTPTIEEIVKPYPIANESGMVELGAGFNPLKPFIENYETVAKPFVKTTETVDAVIRTMDNIAGGKVSQFVNKAFHGDTYREVRKELQVAGQMASQDIASVSDYIASTMTYKLNNDLTDWFANTRRAWSGLNADLAKQFKTIMETLGDFAEIKQGTGVSTKEYALLDTAGRREEKMVEKAGSIKGRRRVIPENEAALNNIGIDPVTFSTLKNLGFIDKYTLKSGGKGVALTQVGKQVADEMIKYSGKTPEELAKFIKKVDRFVAKVNKGQVITLTPEVVESIKKLPNLVDVSPMNIGMDVRKIAKYAPDEKGILRKAQEYSDDEIKRLVDDGYLHEYFNERGEQVYRLTDKGKAVRNEINQASFKDLAIYKDKTAYANLLKKAGISADEDLEEISQLFVNWFQERTVALAEKIPMSEKQLQKLKYQWGKYFPKQRATLSETGLRKIMDNPEIYTKEQVELATDIHNSIKNPKVLGVKVVEYRKNLADAIQRNVDLSDDGVKVPRQWQAEAGLPYNPDLKIAADAKDLVETQYLRSWAFNRSNKEFSDLLQAGRVGVKNVDLVNLTSRVMSKKYDAILPYISNPTDVLQGVMSKVTNTLRMNDAFENLAKHTEYVRTDLDPKLHGTSYTDVVDGVGVTYKYINPEQTEYLSLAGKYVNENVLRSIQTRIDGSAQSLSKFSLDSTWSKFLRPVWYAGMTSSNLSYHAINMVTSGVNMLLHAPQLGLRPFSVAKTSLKWFKTLGSPKLRREFADEIQDMIEHQIIGQENIAVNPKSYGTITRGNIGAFEINKTINKVGVTIQEILEMLPAMANMSDQLARITYYQEKLNDLKRITQKADYKALSPEQQADFVAQFKAKAADQAQTIIPSYIDTANALRAVNEVMPLMSWGMKAYKIPYRNLMTLLGKNDIKGFGKLSKSINMTEKAKAAFALIGLPALAGYYAYNKLQTNREQAMAEAGATPEYRNNFYDQKWCKMIPSIEDLFERQEDYLAAKYVIDAAFNRSFSFETNEGVVKISGSNYGERYRLPEFSSPLVTYGNIIFSGTKVNPFTGTGEPITDKEGWERAKDLLAYTIFVSSANSQRYNSEVRRLKKKGMDEKQARIQAYAKLVDAETLLRYDVITQEDLIKRTKGEQYRLKKQIAGLKKMTPEEQEKAIPGIEKQGERVRVRADLIDYLPKGKEE